MQATWKSDTELVELLGDGWCEDMDVSTEDFSSTGKAAMLEIANDWLAAHCKGARVTDCKDCDDEMSWLIVLPQELQ